MPAFDRRSLRQRCDPDPIARYLGHLQADEMSILWRRGSLSVRQVLEELNEARPDAPLAYTTVLTLTRRLYARGLLEREPDGRGFRYRPAKTREQYTGELSEELIDQIFADFGEIAVARLTERLQRLDRVQMGRSTGADRA